jgi:hypothetical protein
MLASFRGWWKVVVLEAIEIEHVGSFSKEVEGCGDGELPPPSKTSHRARFRGWWKLGGRWWWTLLELTKTGQRGGENLPHSR